MQNIKAKFLTVIEWLVAISIVILVLMVIYPSIESDAVTGIILLYTSIMMGCLFLIFFAAKGRKKIKFIGWLGLVFMLTISVF